MSLDVLCGCFFPYFREGERKGGEGVGEGAKKERKERN